ncbi:uncharacterized protein SPAPADRAFT_141955 [Spathaspora passalidarum NRRL Y-27907]|uniref:SH3 domain-containing protein n=1 Tax=Spathaspora passalidarum (strain NRRL Y-27907 / 11-Y1) TaxID=619300 RepID=G3ASL6_SPAPN|nr:uncharacterized protein SPAPADRAFT_141955 [Spathaspora passalidarum NRRL Y-27907]EGW30702.1 hypothetical protein SPAPADRAFT_141955 [Spathaspora passalidarum NRRL Y-27907]
MNSDITKITNLVSNQLKLVDETVIKNDHFDWNRIKRTPQYFKQKIKYNGGSYTIDEEFNDLEQQFIHYERTIKSLLKHSKVSLDSLIELPECSIGIGESFQNLIDPYNNFVSGGSVIEKEYESWNKVSKYKKLIKDINIDGEINDISKIIESKLEECLRVFKTVQKKFKTREFALLDYDKVYNDLETLIIKQEQGELTLKQNNQLFCLKRRLEENKLKYEDINQVLKRELPTFLELAKQIIAPVQAMTYYINLQFSYEIFNETKKLFPVESISDITSHFFTQNDPVMESIEKFSVLTKVNTDLKQQYVQAMFSFRAQESTDLSIRKGDRIKLLQEDGEWWKGELNGKIGNFPANYVKKV